MQLLTATIAATILIVFSHTHASGSQPGQARDGEEKAAGEVPTVTIWVLSYARRDASPLSDELYLPKTVDPARAKLKGKGVRRIRFNFADKQLALWFEGNQDTTLQEIEGAFPGLQLKLVAKAAFPGGS